MKHSWRLLNLVYRITALVAALALLREFFMANRALQPRLWRTFHNEHLESGGITSSIATRLAILKRRIVGGWTFLAQRDASGEQEWMDLPGQDPVLLADMFKDLRRVNRWLGGGWTTYRGLDRIARQHGRYQPLTILDVASGSVDIPKIMTRWARRRDRSVSIIATDINPDVLALAREPGITSTMHLVAADALRLPFADDAVDVVACSFFLHHLTPPDVVAALQEMRRVSRGSVLINDMVRSWPSFLGAWLFSRLFSRNPISRHDAPLSARRSYTRSELVEMASSAGLDVVGTHGFLGYRVVLVTADVPLSTQRASHRVVVAPVSAS